MAEITSTKLNYTRQEEYGVVNVVQIKLPFNTYNATTSDTVTIYDLPVLSSGYAVVTKFITEISTAEGGTATADFGLAPKTGSAFTADPNGLDDAVNLNATAGSIAVGTFGTDAQLGLRIPLSGGAKLYMTPDHNLDAAIVYVTLEYVLFPS